MGQQYISKTAIVAEIERLRKNQRLDDRHGQGVLDGLHAIERFLDTLKVKEVDWKKEYDDFIDPVLSRLVNRNAGIVIAKHFFELGMITSNKPQKQNNMKQYIDKSAIVALLREKAKESRKNATTAHDNNNLPVAALWSGKENLCHKLLELLDTFEVKEVDLEESARHYLLHEHISPLNEILHQADLKVEMQYHKDIEDAYKAGFMLGLKAKKGE